MIKNTWQVSFGHRSQCRRLRFGTSTQSHSPCWEWSIINDHLLRVITQSHSPCCERVINDPCWEWSFNLTLLAVREWSMIFYWEWSFKLTLLAESDQWSFAESDHSQNLSLPFYAIFMVSPLMMIIKITWMYILVWKLLQQPHLSN